MARLSALFRPSRGLILPPDTSLLNVSGMIPESFRCGIEILNDDRTKMEFVVLILMKHFGQVKSEAHRTMLTIHNRGGILLATTSLEEAQRVSGAVARDAAKLNFPLVCRAVSVAS
jgi:ATP-dependent Clp protease adapter protein ClpS